MDAYLQQIIADDLLWHQIWQRTPHDCSNRAWFVDAAGTPLPYQPMSLCEIRYRLHKLQQPICLTALYNYLAALDDPFLNYR